MQHLVQVFNQTYFHNRPADLVIHSEVFAISPANVNLHWLCCLLGSGEDRVAGRVITQSDRKLLRKMWSKRCTTDAVEGAGTTSSVIL